MAFRLPRLPSNWKEQPQLFERYWDETLNNIEKTLNAILDLPAIQQAVADAQAAAASAQTAADSAQAAADSAQASTADQAEEQSIVNSGVINPSPAFGIRASSTGNITVTNHNRRYGNGTTVAVLGDSFATGGAAGDFYYVYYDDPARAGGSVTYQFSTDSGDSVQGGVRHSVGSVEIPVSGLQDGTLVTPPGIT